MTTTTGSPRTDAAARKPASPNAWVARAGKSAGRFSRRRRRVPYLLLGVVLVAVCAAGGVFAGMHLGDRESVIALARTVAVGQILTAQDLDEVSVAVDSGLETIPASAMSAVVGQPVAFTLPAGSLVTRSVLGSPQVPMRGKAIAAVELKPGQCPPDLSPGTMVAVVTTPGPSTASGTPTVAGSASSWNGVVTGVQVLETGQTTVVSLELSESDARALASTPAGMFSLVVIGRGGR